MAIGFSFDATPQTQVAGRVTWVGPLPPGCYYYHGAFYYPAPSMSKDEEE